MRRDAPRDPTTITGMQEQGLVAGHDSSVWAVVSQINSAYERLARQAVVDVDLDGLRSVVGYPVNLDIRLLVDAITNVARHRHGLSHTVA